MRLRLLVLMTCLLALMACEVNPVDPIQDELACRTRTPTAQPAAPVLCADPSRMQRAEVVRVVDGDTIRVTVDAVEEPVRFYGIDTPERGERCYSEATDRTTELTDREVRLLPDTRDRDRSGRILRYVYTPAGLSIDATLIQEGLALAWREDGNLRDQLIELEDIARMNRVGCLWSH